LTVADGARALLHTCHAGCDPRAIRAAIDNLDLTGKPLYAPAQNSSSGRATPKTTSAHALALWRGAQPVAGTPAETYLRERGFDEPPPATIRFLPRYRYEPQGKYYACMIAAIQAPTREIVAVQLTFLHSGGGARPMFSKHAAQSGQLARALCASQPSPSILASPRASRRLGPRNSCTNCPFGPRLEPSDN
jgi:hypothetical protein